jgi:RimK family alpha-L-glutamate ligase
MEMKTVAEVRLDETSWHGDTRAGQVDVKRLAIVARTISRTNRRLLEAAAKLGLDALVLPPEEAARRLRAGDLALGRLDVLPTLDGPEPGLETLRRLEERKVLVLNRAGALFGAHDKLVTALRLSARGLPHPRTTHVGAAADPPLRYPVVVKPRFGSWGRDVTLCRSAFALERCLRGLGRRAWFRRQGALVQELIQPHGYDLRILVAAGEIVGAVKRLAAPGEWRTNIALGGSRSAAAPTAQACLIALGAAAAVGTDLVGVDLLPDGEGGWVVLELNGAVDFTPEYGLDGEQVFERAVQTLARSARGDAESSGTRVSELSGERSRERVLACTDGRGSTPAPAIKACGAIERR